MFHDDVYTTSKFRVGGFARGCVPDFSRDARRFWAATLPNKTNSLQNQSLLDYIKTFASTLKLSGLKHNVHFYIKIFGLSQNVLWQYDNIPKRIKMLSFTFDPWLLYWNVCSFVSILTLTQSCLSILLTTISPWGFPNIQAMSGLLMDPLSPILKVNLHINI